MLGQQHLETIQNSTSTRSRLKLQAAWHVAHCVGAAAPPIPVLRFPPTARSEILKVANIDNAELSIDDIASYGLGS
jgi:hypothetical protein